MYNDYYLEQINNKLAVTNAKLIQIEENQEAIIQNQQLQYSGDIITRENQVIGIQHIVATNLILILALLYTFIRGCLRC